MLRAEIVATRARLAIQVASRVYREIGHKLRRNGSDAWAGRTIVHPVAKLGQVARAITSWTLGLGTSKPEAYAAPLRPELAVSK